MNSRIPILGSSQGVLDGAEESVHAQVFTGCTEEFDQQIESLLTWIGIE